MSTPKKPTPAQLEALEFMAKQSKPACRPSDYHRAGHGVDVRRDVWERCHDAGWITRESRLGRSTITDLGREALRGAQ